MINQMMFWTNPSIFKTYVMRGTIIPAVFRTSPFIYCTNFIKICFKVFEAVWDC